MDMSGFGEIDLRRLIERIILKPENYVDILGVERIEHLYTWYRQRRLGASPTRRPAYLATGLLVSGRFNEKLEGRKDLGVYLSPKGERIGIDEINNKILSCLKHKCGIADPESLGVVEANDIAREHISMVIITRDHVEIVMLKADPAQGVTTPQTPSQRGGEAHV